MSTLLKSVLELLPPPISKGLQKLSAEIITHLEEIRIRAERPLEIISGGQYFFVSQNGELTMEVDKAYKPNHNDCRRLLDLLTNHSIYTLEEELKRGYITINGGHRIGLSGKAVTENGSVKHLREITSFNIRIAREVSNSAKRLLPRLYDSVSGSIHHTLIVSPPQQGKTTMIRDMARLLSYGNWHDHHHGKKAFKVGVIDERSEIAACRNGVPSFDVGPRTDVLDACPKAEGMMMMIRSMSPDIIIVDEIGRAEDATAIHEALHAGIRVIATAHGHSFEDIRSRPMLNKMMREQVFSRYVVLGRTYGIGRVYRIYDQDGRMIESMIMQNDKTYA